MSSPCESAQGDIARSRYKCHHPVPPAGNPTSAVLQSANSIYNQTPDFLITPQCESTSTPECTLESGSGNRGRIDENMKSNTAANDLNRTDPVDASVISSSESFTTEKKISGMQKYETNSSISATTTTTTTTTNCSTEKSNYIASNPPTIANTGTATKRPEPHNHKLSKTNQKGEKKGSSAVITLENSHIASLPCQRQAIVSHDGSCFTLMVAGESGLGKTTFINTLFNDKFSDASKIKKLFDLKTESMFCDKTTQINIKQAEYEEAGFTVNFTVIDTPGFGDYTNNKNAWIPVVKYIDEQHKIYMLRSEQPDRSKIIDTRVHVCLYFIRPSGHGLLALDIAAMKELSNRVNLIPVLAKADSHTVSCRQYFKQKIREAIVENKLNIYHPPNDEDGLADMEAMPFSVIGAEKLVRNKSGNLVRGREYCWGIAEVDNEDHCDFMKLQKVLMSKHMLDLIDSTNDRHYGFYRQQALINRLFHANNRELTTTKDGIEVLKDVSAYGSEFLKAASLENDPIYAEKETKLRERFDVLADFQEKRFEYWRSELKTLENKLNADLKPIQATISRLRGEVKALERANSPEQPSQLELDKQEVGDGHKNGRGNKQKKAKSE